MSNLKLKTGITALATLFLISILGLMADQAEAAAPPKCPSNKARLLVAKSGGDYTTITAALNNSTPTATSPCLIEVWPGTYIENVTLKSYVNLEGSGRDVTTIQSPDVTTAITISNLTNVAVSGFTINLSGSGFMVSGNSSVDITDNTISDNNVGVDIPSGAPTVTISRNEFIGNTSVGINVNYSFGTYPTVTINQNTFVGNSGAAIEAGRANITISDNLIENGTAEGISFNGTNIIITNNTISGSSNGNQRAISYYNSFACVTTISGNRISNQPGGGIVGGGVSGTVANVIGNIVAGSGNSNYAGITTNTDSGIVNGNRVSGGGGDGIWVGDGDFTVSGNTSTGNVRAGISTTGSMNKIIHNRATGNGTDIMISTGVTPHVGFNVFDTISGSYVGTFNLRSNGTPW